MKAIWNGVTDRQSDDTVVVEGNTTSPTDSLNRDTSPSATTRPPAPGRAGELSTRCWSTASCNADAAWYYADPKPEAEMVKDRVAFWKGVKVDGVSLGASSSAAFTPPDRLVPTAAPGRLCGAEPAGRGRVAGHCRSAQLEALHADWDASAARRLPEGRRPLPHAAPCLLHGRWRDARAGAASRALAAGRIQRAARRHAALVRADGGRDRGAAGLAATDAQPRRSGQRRCAARSAGTSRRTSSASTPPTASAARRPRARTATASTWWRWRWSGATTSRAARPASSRPAAAAASASR